MPFLIHKKSIPAVPVIAICEEKKVKKKKGAVHMLRQPKTGVRRPPLPPRSIPVTRVSYSGRGGWVDLIL